MNGQTDPCTTSWHLGLLLEPKMALICQLWNFFILSLLFHPTHCQDFGQLLLNVVNTKLTILRSRVLKLGDKPSLLTTNAGPDPFIHQHIWRGNVQKCHHRIQLLESWQKIGQKEGKNQRWSQWNHSASNLESWVCFKNAHTHGNTNSVHR